MNNEFIAYSTSVPDLFSLARRVAKYNVPVLISGETGTGKEYVAKFIHENAHPNPAPFVTVDCATITQASLDKLLFGNPSDALVEENNKASGKYASAMGYTMLLNEPADLPAALQAYLVRRLQELEMSRQPDDPGNIRLIAITNKDLNSEIAAGRFRQDLYYYIAVVPLTLLPLRMRTGDILPLAQRFIARYQTFQPEQVFLNKQAQQLLLSYDWPGNIRELDNVIQRALIFCNGEEITPADLGIGITAPALKPVEAPLSPPQHQQNSAEIHDVKRHGRFAEYQYIIDLLRRHNGSKSRTAATLGITPRALRYRLAAMREDGVDISSYL